MNREQLERAIDEAAGRATLLAVESVDHGPRHWRDVAFLGLMARGLWPECGWLDPDVLVLFGAFHDTQREAETGDPGHGQRAAYSVISLYAADRLPGLMITQFSTLITACATHNLVWGSPLGEETIAACFDADRVTLPRVGIRPDLDRLSLARRDEEKARALRALGAGRLQGPDLGWAAVLDLWEEQSPTG